MYGNTSFFIGRSDHDGILVCVFGCGVVPENRFDKGKTPANKPTQREPLYSRGFTIEWPVNRPHTSVREGARQPLTKLQQCDVILASDDERSIHYRDSR